MTGVVWSWLFRALRTLFGKRLHGSHRGVGQGRCVVACLGSSSTDATASYDWIADLAQHPEDARLGFVRFAEGGDLADNGLRRVPAIAESRPAYGVILLGGNDLMALFSSTHARFARMAKHLPQPPSLPWYRANMRDIVRRLKNGTGARIGLCSPTPLGEQPNSSDPFQNQADRMMRQLNAVIGDVAHGEGVDYLPVHEALEEIIAANPGPVPTGFAVLPLYRDAFRRFGLHKTNDEIGELNGWLYHRDGIHRDSRGGRVLADRVQAFLQAP